MFAAFCYTYGEIPRLKTLDAMIHAPESFFLRQSRKPSPAPPTPFLYQQPSMSVLAVAHYPIEATLHTQRNSLFTNILNCELYPPSPGKSIVGVAILVVPHLAIIYLGT